MLTRKYYELHTCQLFLRYKRETFIPGVLGFLNETRSFPKIPEEVWSLPKKSEVFRRRLKSYDVYKHEVASSAFHFKNQRSRGRNCHLFILHIVFVPYMGLSYICLEVVSTKTATTHILESGVRNWPAGVSRREIEVFNLQAWDSRLRRESWQV